MGAMLPPRIWTQQPQSSVGIDWAKSDSKSLALALTCAANLRDSVGGYFAVNNGDFSYAASGKSILANLTGTQYISIPASRFSPPTSEWTYAFTAISSFTGAAPFVSAWQSSSSGRNIYFYYESGLLRFDIPWIQAVFTTAVPSANVPHRYFLTRNGATVTLYVDGVLYGSGTISGSQEVSTVDLAFGKNTGGSNYLVGAIGDVWVWRKGCSPLDAKSDFENPWKIFAPVRRNIFAPAAGGGSSVSLIVSDALHGHVADSPAFSMDTYLAVAESLHSHAADNLTLTASGAADLVVQDAAHAHIADGIALTTQWLLSIAEALHGHSADSLTLDTSNATFLTVQEATHSHGTDGIALTLDTWLAIVDAAHAHTSDAPTLSASLALQIAEAFHAHYADAVVLSFPGVTTLTPDDLSAIAAAVLAALNATTIPVDVLKIKSQPINGSGSPADPWGP